jgi:hypothetical protein
MLLLLATGEERRAHLLAAEAEAARLTELPVADLAAELMPAFGVGGPGRGARRDVNLLQLSNWLLRSFPGGAKYLRELVRPTRDAIHALESAGLVERLGQANIGQRFAATHLGETAIGDGSARQHISG